MDASEKLATNPNQTNDELPFTPETPDMPIESGDVLVSMNLTETTDLTAMMSPKSLADFLKHYGAQPESLAINNTPEASKTNDE